VALVKDEHSLTISGLTPQTPYALVVKGNDRTGNQAESDVQRFTTSTDTRPATITDVKVEGSKTEGSTGVSQLVVSWNTDEPATSQVEFGEGTGSNYSQKTQEDSNLTTNHLVVVTGLTPSKVYHLRVLANDSASNLAQSTDTVTITPKATSSAFNLVLSNLFQVFGFLNTLQTP
jgi:hypothetical protein